MNEHPDWYSFQEEICQYFISLGADAETNVTIEGVRTKHDIDVYIRTRFLGEDLTWLVEAKKWKTRVKKAQVLAFRSIVEDTGADRGFIISENGFQRGAIEATWNTNVKLKTFSELKADTKEIIESEIMKTYKKRLWLIESRYWSHSKETRIKYGLRMDVGETPIRFLGAELLHTARIAIMQAEDRLYPIDLETGMIEQKGEMVANNFQQLINWLNLNLTYFDQKLMLAENQMYENGDYKPDLFLYPQGTTMERAAKASYKAMRSDILT